MKTLFSILTLISSMSFAAVEPGIYAAVDVDTKAITATLKVRANNTANLKLTAPDFVMPEPGCEGAYTYENKALLADMKCPVDGLENVKVKIDITNVNPQSVRAPGGVVVDVTIDALGNESYKFTLKKLE